MNCFVLQVATNNGWYYVYDYAGCSPSLTKAKFFDNIMQAIDFRREFWNDAEYKARCVEIEMNVIRTYGE